MADSGCIYGPTEEWRPVPGLEGFVASNLGRVARVVGHIHGVYPAVCTSTALDIGARLSGTRTKKGDYTAYVVYVHHVIALTFLGLPPAGKDKVNHKDGNRENNAVSNLEWCTQKENIRHCREAGRFKPGGRLYRGR